MKYTSGSLSQNVKRFILPLEIVSFLYAEISLLFEFSFIKREEAKEIQLKTSENTLLHHGDLPEDVKR